MKTAIAVLCLLTLGACSHKPPAPQSDPSAASTQAQVSAPWDALKQDEQRAKDVSKAAAKQAADEDKQIQAQTQ
ncbi:hypothetical protein DWU98_19455 [Dyella monticola]|uniref:Lipoprotein n=1 Tax=Dyella monticola TaxID=1927958 RepID=A0A370WSX6_9GAMM|nr:hypothetical protein [Dyella monticola]RDS79106.1 hypothetical protein DWU98_19455 [Dyella monticola]